jgi:hypothetical protein
MLALLPACTSLVSHQCEDIVARQQEEIESLRAQLAAVPPQKAEPRSAQVWANASSSFPPYHLVNTWNGVNYCLEIPEGSGQPDNMNRTTRVDVYDCAIISQSTTDGRDKWIIEADGRITTQLGGIGRPKCLMFGDLIHNAGQSCPNCGASVLAYAVPRHPRAQSRAHLSPRPPLPCRKDCEKATDKRKTTWGLRSNGNIVSDFAPDFCLQVYPE